MTSKPITPRLATERLPTSTWNAAFETSAARLPNSQSSACPIVPCSSTQLVGGRPFGAGLDLDEGSVLQVVNETGNTHATPATVQADIAVALHPAKVVRRGIRPGLRF